MPQTDTAQQGMNAAMYMNAAWIIATLMLTVGMIPHALTTDKKVQASVSLGEDGKPKCTPDERGNRIPDSTRGGYMGGGVKLQQPHKKTDTAWQASWIGVANKPDPKIGTQWIAYRKVVNLKSVPKQAVARIAVDSKYWLWINGKRVVFEGQLKRGPTPGDTYYDQVDLSDHLNKGENTIAVLLWYFGKSGFHHNSSGKAGLVFEASGSGGFRLLSDPSWKAMVHPSFGSDKKKGSRHVESTIRFDATKERTGWQMPGFDDSTWPAAIEYGVPPVEPWNNLVLRPIPFWKDSGLKDYLNADRFPKTSDGSVIKAKLPYNAQVTMYFKIQAPAGKTVDLRMDNRMGKRMAEYVTREGVQEFETFGWMNGHYVHYTFPAGTRILDLKYRETGYDTEVTGHFECDDPFLNTLRKKAVRTLYVNMRDTYMDCPDRERAQWWGDVVLELGEAFYTFDAKSHLLAKKGILELINWQKRDGVIYSPIPSGTWHKELPGQMLASVGYYGFWTYGLHSGDVETIKTVYPSVKRYMSLWKLGDDGLVIPRKGGWQWIDWGKNKDLPILYNGWYYIALKGQLEMAALLSLEKDVSAIKARMTSIEENFNKAFWNGTAYRSPGNKNKRTDDRAQALAVVSGLAGPDKYDAIRAVLRKEHNASVYMEKYVLEALFVMRFEHDAIDRMKRRYKRIVADNISTLWEHWSRREGSINHGWSGGPLTLLSQYALGVAPVEIGYNVYHVLPQMGPLKHVKSTVPSVKGHIDVELKNQPDVFSLSLASPAGTKAIVGIPRDSDAPLHRIEANGKPVWHAGKAKGRVDGLTFLENGTHYIKFSVKPGAWSFQAQKKVRNESKP